MLPTRPRPLHATLLAACAALVPPTPAWATGGALETDIVFIVDASRSMDDNIAAVAGGLSDFADDLDDEAVDARFAIVLYGIQPEIVLDFTADVGAVQQAFALIETDNDGVPGFQEPHDSAPALTREAGLEAIRMCLNASSEVMQHAHVGGDGRLHYRPEALKNLILVTDADSDQPFHLSNRFPGQDSQNPPGHANFGGGWQAEVDLVAAAAIDQGAFVNMLMKRAGNDCRGAQDQYGDHLCDVSDDDLLNYDGDATLTCLEDAGHGGSLQAQLLRAGLVGRTFNVKDVDDPGFVENFFRAKIEEIVGELPNPVCMGIGCPCGNDDPGAGCANSTGSGALLAATGSMSVGADDLVLTATGVPAGKWGMLYAGQGVDNCSMWGDGLRAVQPGPPGPFFRLGAQNSGAAGLFVEGPGLAGQYPLDFTPGTTWRFQAYYRDDHAPSPCGWHFNLSNAVEIHWSN